MKKIELNHWFINENDMSISLIRVFASIKILTKNNKLCFRVTLVDEKNNSFIFDFDCLEEAVTFVEKHNKMNIDETIENNKKILKRDIKKNKL